MSHDEQMSIYCLRRKPQTSVEERACAFALETLARTGRPIADMEVDVMRRFSPAELAAIESHRLERTA